MSTSFTFGFEDGDADGVGESTDDYHRKSEDIAFTVPQLHPLHEILSTFPSQISFSKIFLPSTDENGVEIPRRDLFDIRAQLMAEDEIITSNNISGLSNDDIIPNIYEGGFKTWECSTDLSNYVLSGVDIYGKDIMNDCTLIELGAGTALPSITLTHQWLSQISQHPEAVPRLQLCLADYNRSVLELVTLPNLYLALASYNKPITGNEVDTKLEVLHQFEEELSTLNINVAAISGSWSPKLVEMISSMTRPASAMPHETIVLASETIYSPASLQNFTETLLGILNKAQEQGSAARALVAAKRVYFGVGGGTDEFLRLLKDLGGRGTIVWETQGAGVGRVIIEVTMAIPNESLKALR